MWGDGGGGCSRVPGLAPRREKVREKTTTLIPRCYPAKLSFNSPESIFVFTIFLKSALKIFPILDFGSSSMKTTPPRKWFWNAICFLTYSVTCFGRKRWCCQFCHNVQAITRISQERPPLSWLKTPRLWPQMQRELPRKTREVFQRPLHPRFRPLCWSSAQPPPEIPWGQPKWERSLNQCI